VSVQTAVRRIARRRPRAARNGQNSYLFRARVRLTLWYVGVLSLLLVALGASVYAALTQVLRNEVDSDLKSAAVAFRERNSAFPAGPPLHLPGQAQGLSDGAFLDVFAFFIGISDFSVYNPRNVDIAGFPDGKSVIAASTGRTDLSTVNKAGQPYRVLSEPILQGSQIVGVLQVFKSLRPYQHDVKDIAFVLAGGGLGAVLLAFVGGLLLSGRALRPVQQSWQRQQSFVADASHELRTPLAIVRADAEVMLRAPEKSVEEHRELVEDIVVEADRLGGLVSDMLLLVRLDTGQLPLQRIDFDARGLLEDVAEQTRRVLEGRQITVVTGGKPYLPVCADRDRMLQVLRILVDNAQRHTPVGGRIELYGRGDGTRVSLEVGDSGSGIAPADMAHIFDRFYRADRARGRAEGGAGLGLAIARALVEAHEGRLKLQSQLGRGTTVTVELPSPPRGTVA
jgi:two-component system sensor histidine kinase CiaH